MACILPPTCSIDACSPYERQFDHTHALSIKQPFASLVVFGIKTLEIRTRKTNIRGRILICSSLKPFVDGMFHPERPGHFLPNAGEYVSELGEFALFGHAIGMVDIVGCRPMEKNDFKKALVEYQPGLFAWELENPVEIVPFKVTGNLGFFKVSSNQIRVKSGLAV